MSARDDYPALDWNDDQTFAVNIVSADHYDYAMNEIDTLRQRVADLEGDPRDLAIDLIRTGRWQTDGFTSPAEWLAVRRNMTNGQAARLISFAETTLSRQGTPT